MVQVEEDIDVLEQTDVDESTENDSKIVVYNDDFNTFDHVIECLMLYCKHTREQAEQCAWFIHNNGKYAVKEGSKNTLKPINEALCNNGLDSKIE